MYYLRYNQNLKEFSATWGNNATLGEILLWKQLREGSIKVILSTGKSHWATILLIFIASL
ncbi:MAG: hypothetical protein ACTHOF_04640 [Flavisolibacter sp.]